MAKKVKHDQAGMEYKVGVPGGTPSAAYEATHKPAPVTGTSSAAPPRQDPGNQAKFWRGASRVWNIVRPKASSKYKA